MPKNSRRKGAEAERELASALTDAGFPARRGQQFCGGAESPDVICPTLGRVHWECKRVEALNIRDAMIQSISDAGPHRLPVVAHRRNRGTWLLTMRLEDFLSVAREALEHLRTPVIQPYQPQP